jgi:hypothetical protein
MRVLLRARATFSASHDRELREELQLYLRLLEEEYTAQGMPRELARRRAHREFGNATQFQEVSHDLFSFRLLEELIGDLRYAMREMRRSVGFTCVAVLSLAVGIGAITAAFAVVDVFMLRGLPVRDPERLVAFSTNDSPTWARWTYASFSHWRNSPDRLFEVAAASDVTSFDVPLRGHATPGEVRVSLVSGDYFQVVGVDIALGRALSGEDSSVPGAAAAAVVSDAFWERWFGRMPDVLTKTIDINGFRYEVVGVARKGFTGHTVGYPSDVWIPLTMQSALMPGSAPLLDDRWGIGARWLRLIARPRSGVSLEEAAVSANLIRQRFLADKAAALGAGSPEIARERKEVVPCSQPPRAMHPTACATPGRSCSRGVSPRSCSWWRAQTSRTSCSSAPKADDGSSSSASRSAGGRGVSSGSPQPSVWRWQSWLGYSAC